MHCQLNNGALAVVKYPNNIEGPLVLINELLSYKIARAIGVKTPDCGICILDARASFGNEYQDQINSNDEIKINEDNYGICFYSEYIPYTIPLNPTFVKRLSNLDDFQSMIIFDHIIYNKDRHNGNILVDASKMIFYAIDHSHVFKNECIWDALAFKQGINEKDYNDDTIIKNNLETYKWIWKEKKFDQSLAKEQIQNFSSILTSKFISDIISQLPENWVNGIPKKDIEWLEKYLNYRIDNLENIVNNIYKSKEELFYEKN